LSAFALEPGKGLPGSGMERADYGLGGPARAWSQRTGSPAAAS